MIQLPTFDMPAFRETVTLDGVAYVIALTWNERGQGWSFSLEDVAGNPLVHGRRVVLGVDLLMGSRYRAVPPGAIIALDPSKEVSAIGREDLTSGRVQLLYLTEEDLDAL